MKKRTAILFGLLLINAISIASAIGTDDLNAKKLVTVYIENQDDVDILSDLGLDIWEVEQGRVIARVYDWQIIDLKGKGYSVERLSHNYPTTNRNYTIVQTSKKTLSF